MRKCESGTVRDLGTRENNLVMLTDLMKHTQLADSLLSARLFKHLADKKVKEKKSFSKELRETFSPPKWEKLRGQKFGIGEKEALKLRKEQGGIGAELSRKIHY